MDLNATLFAQIVVFVILWVFTMKFVWPPITKALDERAAKVAEGLSAADKAKTELDGVRRQVSEQLSAARDDAAKRLADAERLAQQTIEEAKTRAAEEGARIIAAARIEAEQQGYHPEPAYKRNERRRVWVLGAIMVPISLLIGFAIGYPLGWSPFLWIATGLGISLWPWIVPPSIDIWQASSPPRSTTTAPRRVTRRLTRWRPRCHATPRSPDLSVDRCASSRSRWRSRSASTSASCWRWGALLQGA